MTLVLGIACKNEFQALLSKPSGMTTLGFRYTAIFCKNSFFDLVGTGTNLSLTSSVSFIPFDEKRPRIFLQTRPVIIVCDWLAGALGVGDADARTQDNIP
jgi:hypothetical protein